MDGILIVWKPVGMSSFGVVSRVRKLANTKKVGHGGTLDPLAEGVLVLALGRATRVLEYMQTSNKSYKATAVLGARSTTYDAEGALTTGDERIPTYDEIEHVLASFVGETLQRPPVFSALHIDGERAYVRARRGEQVEMPLRSVYTSHVVLEEYAYPEVTFSLQVSGGTYIRSIIHDMGDKLGTGAYMSQLVRMVASGFTKEQAHTLEDLERDGVGSALLSLETQYLELPVVQVSEEVATGLRQGKRIPFPTTLSGVVQIAQDTRCLGIVEVKDGVLHPYKMW